jgi:hypothetical protein
MLSLDANPVHDSRSSCLAYRFFPTFLNAPLPRRLKAAEGRATPPKGRPTRGGMQMNISVQGSGGARGCNFISADDPRLTKIATFPPVSGSLPHDAIVAGLVTAEH